MKKLYASLLAIGAMTTGAQAQFFNNTDVHVGSDAIVSINMDLKNEGKLSSEGQLLLKGNLNNDGVMALNGKLVINGAGLQEMVSNNQLAISSLSITQENKSSKLRLGSPILVSEGVAFGRGLIESTENSPLILGENAAVSGASDASHVKGFVRKKGDSSFEFPIGNGVALHSLTLDPAAADELTVGYLAQNPNRLSIKRSAEVAEIVGDDYWVVSSLSGNQLTDVRVNQVSSNGISDAGLVESTDGTWKLARNGASLPSGLSAETTLKGTNYFTVGTKTLSSNESADVAAVFVSPNPSNGSFDVQLRGFSQEESIQMDIIDLSGRTIVNQTGKVKELSKKYSLGDEVRNGSYILKVIRTDRNQTFNNKLSITR